MRRNLWGLVWVIAVAVAITGLPLLAFFAPKLSFVGARLVVDAQSAARGSGAALALRGAHAILGLPILAAAVLAVVLSLSRSRWKSRVLTVGPAVIAAVWVADRTGTFLSNPELVTNVVAGEPTTVRVGAVPFSLWLVHVLGGLGAVLGVIGLWTISHRTGRSGETTGEVPE